jgi:hypothetical protein
MWLYNQEQSNWINDEKAAYTEWTQTHEGECGARA